jgi:hypothetical protein
MNAPETHEIGTGMNAPETHEMGTGMNAPNSREMGTGMNAPHSREIGIQKSNNNNGRNIPSMTEDELLQQYTSVYEKMTSKEDAKESAALFKPYLKTIQNPIAFYIVAHKEFNNQGSEYSNSAAIRGLIITRNDVYHVAGNFMGWPLSTGHPHSGIHMSHDRFRTSGYKDAGKNMNSLTVHSTHKFKKPLDSRLIHMFQTISKNPLPNIGYTTNGWIPDAIKPPNTPIGNFMDKLTVVIEVIRAL